MSEAITASLTLSQFWLIDYFKRKKMIFGSKVSTSYLIAFIRIFLLFYVQLVARDNKETPKSYSKIPIKRRSLRKRMPSSNCKECGSPWDNQQSAPVGNSAENAFGLHDMPVNV
mgnify:CR=1 FL=1